MPHSACVAYVDRWPLYSDHAARQGDIVERAGVGNEAMANDFDVAFRDGPVGVPRARCPDAELVVDAPRQRIAGIVGVIEERNVREIVAPVDLHRDVDPHRALAFGARVALPRGIDDFGAHPRLPRHAEEEPSVVVLADRYVDASLAAPLEIEKESPAIFTNRPSLGLREHRVAGGVQQVVNRLPADYVAARLRDRRGDATPIVALPVVEIVAAVEAREAPIESGLMFVMFRAELGERRPCRQARRWDGCTAGHRAEHSG